jgi:hypothetical protein
MNSGQEHHDMTTSASETETLELDPAAVIPPDQVTELRAPPPDQVTEAPKQPEHLARCASCAFSVRFRPLQSGHGFMLVGSEESLGIGEDGRPTCLNGHGQMEIADDQLPAAEAFALAQEQLNAREAPVQGELPGIVPEFNWRGGYLELEEMSVEVDRLQRIHEDDAREAKESKKAWEEASKRRDRAALELRRRRLAKVAAAEPPAQVTNLVRCKWEEQHPDLNCPICSDLPYAKRYFGDELAPRDSERHVEQIQTWQTDREINGAVDALDAIDIIITAPVVRGWSSEDRAAVENWAVASLEGRDDSTVTIPERPSVLGTGHLAGPAVDGEAQHCTQCDLVLIAADDPNYYDPKTIVGTDCKGKPPARYPAKRGRGKKSA